MKTQRKSGFTVAEIIVVLFIISLLAALGYQSYRTLKQQSRRADAQIAVISTEMAIEGYLVRNNKANFTSTDLALARFADYDATSVNPVYSQKGFYRITIIPGSPGYRINATATVDGSLTDCNLGGNAQVKQCGDTTCREIAIDNGARVSRNSAGVAASATTTTCW